MKDATFRLSAIAGIQNPIFLLNTHRQVFSSGLNHSVGDWRIAKAKVVELLVIIAKGGLLPAKSH